MLFRSSSISISNTGLDYSFHSWVSSSNMPTDLTLGGGWSRGRGEALHSACTHRGEGEGGHASVLFLGLLVAVT